MPISKRMLKELREKRGWSQDQLASICGLSSRTIQRIESSGNCSLESQMALASAFSVPITHLQVQHSAYDYFVDALGQLELDRVDLENLLASLFGTRMSSHGSATKLSNKAISETTQGNTTLENALVKTKALKLMYPDTESALESIFWGVIDDREGCSEAKQLFIQTCERLFANNQCFLADASPG